MCDLIQFQKKKKKSQTTGCVYNRLSLPVFSSTGVRKSNKMKLDQAHH